MTTAFTLNGLPITIDVPPHWTLLRALRDTLGQMDVKHGCGEGGCGACAVRVDGVTVSACLLLAPQADGAVVETAAGLAGSADALHPLQEAFLRHGAVQCGFCTPGMLLGALEAVENDRGGSREEIRRSLAGNLCRCTGYGGIVDAVEEYRDGCCGDRAPS